MKGYTVVVVVRQQILVVVVVRQQILVVVVVRQQILVSTVISDATRCVCPQLLYIVEKWADPARSCGLHSKASKTDTAPDPPPIRPQPRHWG